MLTAATSSRRNLRMSPRGLTSPSDAESTDPNRLGIHRPVRPALAELADRELGVSVGPVTFDQTLTICSDGSNARMSSGSEV